jgi:hypothetical protein
MGIDLSEYCQPGYTEDKKLGNALLPAGISYRKITILWYCQWADNG